MKFDVYELMRVGDEERKLLANDVEIDVNRTGWKLAPGGEARVRGKTYLAVPAESSLPDLILSHAPLVIEGQDGLVMTFDRIDAPVEHLADGRLRIAVCPA